LLVSPVSAAESAPLCDDARGLYFAPIRHHSPACAQHLRALLREVKPRQVLIEAPIDFEPLIPLLLDPATRPPVAIAAFGGKEDSKRVSYYPFSSHAPEYVAIVEAQTLGARTGFIDLPSGVRLGTEPEDSGRPNAALSLADEKPFSLSDYTRALCERTGCRDQNELWDHLFETKLGSGDWRAFFASVGAYCACVRDTASTAAMEEDGTFSREAHMAARLAEALESEGPIVVVTGGFHTSALIRSLTAATPKAKAAKSKKTEKQAEKSPPVARSYLIRYGFQELDRLNGYAAGLPLPFYYERLWQAAGKAEAGAPHDFWRQTAVELLSEFTAHLRKTQPGLVPPFPAVVNAVEHASLLADLRGRPGPTRQDLLDAVQSCFVKGESLAGATPILDALRDFLTGTALGDAPPSAGSPPLVEATRTTARKLGFDLDYGARKNRELDIHRSERHQKASRFLHAMTFVGAGYATRVNGPDFFSGHAEDLLFETWSAAWSPMVEAKLIELSPLGESIEAVALTLLRARIAALRDKETDGRGAAAAIRLLLTACQIGLQERIVEILPIIEEEIANDPDLASVGRALSQLFLLWRARNILGMVGNAEVERLMGVAYRRALFLLGHLKDTSAERLKETLAGLATLREVVTSAGTETPSVDPSLFDEAIERRLDDDLAPVLAGATAALAYLAGLRDAAFLVERVIGHLSGAYADPGENVAVLNGVAAISPELLWRSPELLAAIDALIAGLDDARFIEQLPHLRLAFATLNPNETDQAAAQIAARNGADAGAALAPVMYGASEEELLANLALSEKIKASLTEDGMSHWATAPLSFGKGERSLDAAH
jgi:hypothetical protein